MHGMSGDDVEMLRAIKRGKQAEQEQTTEATRTFVILRHKSDHPHLVQESIDRLRQYAGTFGFEIERLETRKDDGKPKKERK